MAFRLGLATTLSSIDLTLEAAPAAIFRMSMPPEGDVSNHYFAGPSALYMVAIIFQLPCPCIYPLLWWSRYRFSDPSRPRHC